MDMNIKIYKEKFGMIIMTILVGIILLFIFIAIIKGELIALIIPIMLIAMISEKMELDYENNEIRHKILGIVLSRFDITKIKKYHLRQYGSRSVWTTVELELFNAERTFFKKMHINFHDDVVEEVFLDAKKINENIIKSSKFMYMPVIEKSVSSIVSSIILLIIVLICAALFFNTLKNL